MRYYLIILNFKVLWPKILPPDLKTLVYTFFYSFSTIHALTFLTHNISTISGVKWLVLFYCKSYNSRTKVLWNFSCEKIWENWENLFFHKIRTLECHANGHPKPKIKWLREDKGNITVYDRNNKRMIGKLCAPRHKRGK